MAKKDRSSSDGGSEQTDLKPEGSSAEQPEKKDGGWIDQYADDPTKGKSLRLNEESGTQVKDVPPIKLRSPHDFALSRATLSRRREELEKFAKGVEAQGYPREARAILADAGAIKFTILPAFDEAFGQRSFVEIQEETLRSALTHYFLAPLQKAKVRKDSPEAVAERLSARVASILRHAVESAYGYGYADRENEPRAIALRALEAAREDFAEKDD